MTAAFTAAGVALRAPIQRLLDPPRDVSVEGRVCCGEVEPSVWLTRLVAPLGERVVTLRAGDEWVEAREADLGFRLDAERTLPGLLQVSAPADLVSRLERAWSPPLAPTQVPAQFVFDSARARTWLNSVRAVVERPAQDAVFHPASHTRTQEGAGRALEIEASLLRLSVAEPARIPFDALVFSAVEPKLRLADFPDVDVTQVAGSYETDFKGKAGARAVNIRRAAQLLNGLIIPPGGRFSFNRSVGKREKERGFVEAPVIVNDELESGLGGGVCQAATTLHAAARFAGLNIVERRSHSRASGYAPLGLDATVIDGKVDLRFENPFDEPLMVQAYLPTPTTVRVEILGRAGNSHVEHRYQVLERQPFQRRVVEKSELAPGSFERKQKGSYGFNIVSVLTLTDASGSVHTTRYPSKYYPVPEVFAVGPGTEPSALPELPPGATGLEEPAPELIR